MAVAISSAIREVFSRLGLSVKPEQEKIIGGILKGDVFVILPTGFGKSACFQCLPWLYDKLYEESKAIHHHCGYSSLSYNERSSKCSVSDDTMCSIK